MKIIYQLPKLYIYSNKKKRFWHIWIEEDITIHREYGTIDGKITIPKPLSMENLNKSITKVNDLWLKKKESGFYEDFNVIKSKSDKVKPMGAHKLDLFYNKIKYPAFVQRKLDGFRCLANNSILYSKNMKPFIFLNHIKRELSTLKNILNNNIYLDGELYEFGLQLHQISSLVTKKYATKEDEEEMKDVSYYIFDIFDINNLQETFCERYAKLKDIFDKNKFIYLKLVTCEIVNSYSEIENLNTKYIYDGYEGIIVRNMDGIYKLNTKSYDVLRTKEFKKKEFEIIGAKKGSGTQDGAIIWKLKCLNNNQKYFWAIPLGSIPERVILYKDYLKNNNKYIGKKVNVKYLDIDKSGCVIRNPIVIK
jgi:ATP-dependent DNA ligase